MEVEVCASNPNSVLAAIEAGAHRLELCSELGIGGITPSYGFIKQTMKTATMPVNVLIRPRGGDFTYSDAEFEIMKTDIAVCKEMGCSGIVSGVLNDDQTIDTERTQTLIALSRPLSFTFHRAFDWTPDPYIALNSLIQLNVNRILTSGQEPSAEKGIFVLQRLKKLANGKVIILPGGGINAENISIFRQHGFDEIHCSAVMGHKTLPIQKISLNSPKFLDESYSYSTNVELLKSIIAQF
ncbi:MAG TPA: copper homeostasis protein CutC [Aquaticitalea sp.]|nr:copper homeostasis protein CutC [Aquaticitalea sp.]